MPKITLNLPQHWLDLIDREVAAGRHQEPRWVAAEALGLLEEELEQEAYDALGRSAKSSYRASVRAAMLAAIDEGLADLDAGRVETVDNIDDFMDGLRRAARPSATADFALS